jgi:TolB-like protein/Tfp pilus assembly protein PilF
MGRELVMNISNFIQELKRRNVIKVATAYAIAGWIIIQVTDTVFPRLGLPEWTITFVIALVGIGLPISLIFAWAFELTPEGIKKSKEVEITESVTSKTGKKLNTLIISVLSIALFFVVLERVFFAKASIMGNVEASMDIETASIAVLPFVNMSSDPENEFFSDGLSEELLNALAKITDMKVAGRTSTFKFKGQNENLSLIAKELKVDYILEGSVRKSGDRVRITAQLIKADDGYHLWSETYDRELTTSDVFDIQEEITGHVVEELKIKLLPEEEDQIVSRPTDNLEAYEAFLKATQKEVSMIPSDIEEAILLYERAVDLDPEFTEAYARLALAHGALFGVGNISVESTLENMKENIDQALLSDKSSGWVYNALSWYHRLNGDEEKAEEALIKAVEMMPNDALTIMAYAQFDNDRYRDQVNVERINRAYELDSDHPYVATEYARYLYWIDEFEESLKLIDEVMEDYPDFTAAYDFKMSQIVDAPYGEMDEAFKIAYELYQKKSTDVTTISNLVEIATSLGMNGFAEEVINNLKRDLPNNPNIFRIERFLYFSTQDTTQIHDLRNRVIEYYDLEEGDAWRFKLINYYLAGEYQKGVQVLEDENPGLNEGSFDPEMPNMLYSIFLSKSGNKKKGREIANTTCEFLYSRMESQPNETYRVNDNWVRLTCQLVQENYEDASENLRALYFEQKSKANWYYFNLATLPRQVLFEEPVFNDLIADIDTDINTMRSNAVEYLKAEGEWKEEWEEN